MTSRVSIKNKEKKAERKNSVKKKKERLTRDKSHNRTYYGSCQRIKGYTETENSVTGSRTRFICTFKQLLVHCTTVI